MKGGRAVEPVPGGAPIRGRKGRVQPAYRTPDDRTRAKTSGELQAWRRTIFATPPGRTHVVRHAETFAAESTRTTDLSTSPTSCVRPCYADFAGSQPVDAPERCVCWPSTFVFNTESQGIGRGVGLAFAPICLPASYHGRQPAGRAG